MTSRFQTTLASLVLGAAALTAMPQAAMAQGQLNLYCSVQVEWCQAVATNFQKATGITVNMTQKGSGETLAQICAESQRPRGDVWFGGTVGSASGRLRGRPAHRLLLAIERKTSRLGAQAARGVGRAIGRHLFRRDRLRHQHRASRQEGHHGHRR